MAPLKHRSTWRLDEASPKSANRPDVHKIYVPPRYSRVAWEFLGKWRFGVAVFVHCRRRDGCGRLVRVVACLIIPQHPFPPISFNPPDTPHIPASLRGKASKGKQPAPWTPQSVVCPSAMLSCPIQTNAGSGSKSYVFFYARAELG